MDQLDSILNLTRYFIWLLWTKKWFIFDLFVIAETIKYLLYQHFKPNYFMW